MNMLPMVMGMESELSISPRGCCGAVVSSMIQNRTKIPWMMCSGQHDVFMSNGSRMYVDCGHSEYATPECLDPKDVAKHAFAGYRIVGELAKLSNCHVFRHNYDYVSGTTWGCHESYTMRSVGRIMDISEHKMSGIIAHLASRVCFTGAGGIAGGGFSISPRLLTFNCETGGQTTHDRPIFNLRDEPLGSNGVRLHLICGDMLCSQLATWLKVATTALVIRMYDADCGPRARMGGGGGGVLAMRNYVSDPTLKHRENVIFGDNNVAMTAVEVQRAMHAAVASHLGKEWMPSWGAEVVEEWGKVIEALSEDIDSLAYSLDWVTKKKLFDAHMSAKRWNWNDSARAYRKEPDALKSLVEQQQDLINSATELALLANELKEIDMKFGEVGGLSDAMAGTLEYQTLFDDAAIDHATTNAPEGTRAKPRGDEIKRLWGAYNPTNLHDPHSRGNHVASWDCLRIFDETFFLSDPLNQTPVKWAPSEPAPSDDYAHNAQFRAGDWVLLEEHKGVGRQKGWSTTHPRMVGKLCYVEAVGQVDPFGHATLLVTDRHPQYTNDRIRMYWRCQSASKPTYRVNVDSQGCPQRPPEPPPAPPPIPITDLHC